MVSQPNAHLLPSPAALGERILSSPVRLSEVVEAGFRFEASAFDAKARTARNQIRSYPTGSARLAGLEGLTLEWHNAFRFKRVYVPKETGIPFLSSSDIISLRPAIDRYLSRKLTNKLEELLVREHDVLVSCSGTI